MKRELKFRAWVDYVGPPEMHYFDLVTRVMQYVAECDVMQYTGLKDKNEKEIYESDILDCFGYLFKVEWNDVLSCFDMTPIKHTNCRNVVYCSSNGEVIGNIHQNPELLK